jgi:hypothetical protein
MQHAVGASATMMRMAERTCMHACMPSVSAMVQTQSRAPQATADAWLDRLHGGPAFNATFGAFVALLPQPGEVRRG